MRGMRVSVGQLDTRALLDSMAALRSEAQSVRERIVAGSIPHDRLSALIEEIESSARLLGSGFARPAETIPTAGFWRRAA